MNKYKINLSQKFDSESKLISYLIFDIEWDFSFKEWQFVMLETELNWKLWKRAYSIASTNKLAQEKKQICFYVKKVSENWMSDFLTQKINIWNEITMSPAFGHMINQNDKENYLLISIWSWNAGMKAIYENLTDSWNYKKIFQLFGERFLDNLIKKVSEVYEKEDKNTQTNIYISKDNITEEWIKKWNLTIFKWHVQDWIENAVNYFGTKDIKVFVCGKPEMTDEINNKLIELWVNAENIKIEKY